MRWWSLVTRVMVLRGVSWSRALLTRAVMVDQLGLDPGGARDYGAVDERSGGWLIAGGCGEGPSIRETGVVGRW